MLDRTESIDLYPGRGSSWALCMPWLSGRRADYRFTVHFRPFLGGSRGAMEMSSVRVWTQCLQTSDCLENFELSESLRQFAVSRL